MLPLWPRSAQAGAPDPDASDLSRAHDAYARGTAAYAQGDYARAAREMSAADALVPDPVTLRVALEAVTLADDPVLAAELLTRAARAPGDPALAHAASVAAARFAHRTGSIVVRCDDCLALVDGVPAHVNAPTVVLPGVHTVTVQRQTAPESRLVSVAVDQVREVTVHARDLALSPLPSSPLAREASGLSPAWFVAAAGATAALGAATIGSAVDTLNDHASFQSQRCGVVATGACASEAQAGQSAQTRTTGLGVATAAVAAGTLALGLFAVRWHATPARAEVTLAVTGRQAALRLSF
jgi:hypothetical protein